MLKVIGLTCSRNEKLLFKNLSFSLTPNSGLQIRAANGVGKTTLLKVIAGLLPATSGQVHNLWPMMYLGHKQNIHPALTVAQNLIYLHTINTQSDVSTTISKQILYRALDYVALGGLADKFCAHLSAGQLQRINLARLFLSTAKLWLLDEPFANLDGCGQELLLELCSKHLASNGALLLASHTNNTLENLTTLDLDNYA